MESENKKLSEATFWELQEEMRKRPEYISSQIWTTQDVKEIFAGDMFDLEDIFGDGFSKDELTEDGELKPEILKAIMDKAHNDGENGFPCDTDEQTWEDFKDFVIECHDSIK